MPEEDYPGQQREMERERTITEAVAAADQIIMAFSDGSVEELDYLTSAVTKRFMGKVHGRNQSKLLAHDLQERLTPDRSAS